MIQYHSHYSLHQVREVVRQKSQEWCLVCAISLFRFYEKTPSEITKRRNNARRKDEITKCTTRNDKKTSAKRRKKRYAKRQFKLVFLSFRLAPLCYFVFSPGIISSFRYFAWRFFVISSFRVALFSLFAPPLCRHDAKRNDEKTK